MENRSRHSLETNNIVLRQDDDESEFIENRGGIYVPLVRVKDTVLPMTSLKSFSLTIGQSFLPTLSFSFNDDDFHYRETDFIEQNDVVTIFVGSMHDEVNEPIKNDYLVKYVDGSPGSSTISLECELFVPELYNGQNRTITATSIEVLEQIAQDCLLGFTTNITSSNDSMNWIQYQNNIDFIKEVTERSYIDEMSSVRVFVDQFANLTVVNLNTAITGLNAHVIEIDPTSGLALEEPLDLLLTMNKLDSENVAKIGSYTPINSYGANTTKFSESQSHTILDYEDYTTIEETIGEARNTQLENSSNFTTTLSENTHPKFQVAPALNVNNMQVIQGMHYMLSIDWSIQSLFMMQVVPVDIYNIAKKPYKKSVDENMNLDELTDTESEQTGNSHLRNDTLSGDCLILEMTFTYVASSNRLKESRLKQKLKVFKI